MLLLLGVLMAAGLMAELIVPVVTWTWRQVKAGVAWTWREVKALF